MPKPLTVAYVTGGLPYGGVESWLYDVAAHAARRPGLRAVIVNVSGTGERRADFRDAGFEVHDVMDSKRALATHRLDTVLALRRALKALAPDLVHTLHYSGNYFGRLAALGLGVPVVCHLRNTMRQTKPLRRAADRLLSRATSHYLSVSLAVDAVVQADHNRAGRPHSVLYNAVDFTRLDVAPARLDLEQDARPILAVGRLKPQKNLPFLVACLAALTQRIPPACLVIAGDGGERAAIEAAAREHGVADRLHMLGLRDDVPAVMRAVALRRGVLAMPSLYEGLPITHLEAMACGLPAVISPHAPSAELAGAAALVAPLKAADFAEALVVLLTEDTAYDQARETALTVGRASDFGAYMDRLVDLYRKLTRST